MHSWSMQHFHRKYYIALSKLNRPGKTYVCNHYSNYFNHTYTGISFNVHRQYHFTHTELCSQRFGKDAPVPSSQLSTYRMLMWCRNGKLVMNTSSNHFRTCYIIYRVKSRMVHCQTSRWSRYTRNCHFDVSSA